MSHRYDTGTDNLRAAVDTQGVLRIVLDNPERHNSLTGRMLGGLQRLFATASGDPGVRAILVRGAGEVAFASGADIGEQSERASAGETNPDRGGFVPALLSCTKPVVAMIHGWCLGGGLLVAMTADIRVAADDARFSIPASRLGVAYPLAATHLLVDIVGRGAASDLLLSGDRIDAVEAHRIGLVSRLVPKGDLEAETEELLATLAANAPLSMTASKASIGHACDARRDGTDEVVDLIDGVWASEDARAGMTAFFAKERPTFEGR
ncbi:MAG: enoyl-CoA hydratase-related protein [Actinomycetota bacterium]